MGPRFRGDDSKSLLPRANSPIQLSNSLSQRSAARILCRGPGEARLLSPPAQCEAMERRAAQPVVQRLAALPCLCEARSPHGAPPAAFLSAGTVLPGADTAARRLSPPFVHAASSH